MNYYIFLKNYNTMKINITKKQYWNLLRATYMADWMANAICEGDMKKDKGIKDIRNYIFSFAKEFNREKYVLYDEGMKTYYATLDLDDEPQVRDFIERYDNHAFWDEILDRLGERDFFEKYSTEELEKMKHEERMRKIWECEEQWDEEFAKHGIERLQIVEDKKKKKEK